MKKTLLCCLAICSLMGMYAAEPAKRTSKLQAGTKKEIYRETGRFPGIDISLKSCLMSIAKAPSRDYILGDYEIDYWDQYNNRGIVDIATISAGASENEVVFSIPIDLGQFGGRPVVDFPATYENGIITFTSGTHLNITINERDFEDDLFLYRWRDDESDYDFIQTATAVWSGYGFEFNDNDIFCMADPKDDLGAWFAIGQIIAEKDRAQNPDYDYNEGWSSLGMAHFQDGWVLPGFEIDQFAPENIWEVELQQNDENPNIYRLVDPYKGRCPIAEYNESNRVGYIQFDVTFPDYVTFYPVDAGFAYEPLGIKKFYCQNFMTYMVGFFGDAPEDIIEEFDSPSMQWGSFKDGIVHLPYFNDGDYGMANDACFGFQGKVFSASNWVKDNPDFLFGEPVNMDTKIYFPGKYESGVNNVAFSKEETRYFNLQGIEIKEPVKGDIIILNTNGKTKKIIF